MKINLEKQLNIKIFILIVMYLIFFYFFIFENIISYLELKNFINNENIKIQHLEVENTELEKSLSKKRKNMEEELLVLEKSKGQSDTKLEFSKFADAFEYINNLMDKNNIFFESFSRIQKNGKNFKINLTFNADEKELINFLRELENSEYYFNLSSSYFKIFSSDNLVTAKIPILFKVSNNYEKIEIVGITTNNNIFFKNEQKSKNSSFMRIGNNKFFRSKRETTENKTSGGL